MRTLAMAATVATMLGCMAETEANGCEEAWERSADSGADCEAALESAALESADSSTGGSISSEVIPVSRDAASGMATGKRAHKPYCFTYSY